MKGKVTFGILTVVLLLLGGMREKLCGKELKPGAHYEVGCEPLELTKKLKVGEKVSFSLLENGTTGYQWQIVKEKIQGKVQQKGEKMIMEKEQQEGVWVQLEHQGPPQTQPMLCGAPGKVVVKLEGKKGGTYQIRLEYLRSWEPLTPAAVVNLQVTVEKP